jgi:hypothetical protein
MPQPGTQPEDRMSLTPLGEGLGGSADLGANGHRIIGSGRASYPL